MTTQTSAEISERSETADGMRIDWDVPVPMADGTILRADVFRPDDEGVYPVLMTLGPYGKGLAFQEGFGPMWQQLISAHPDAAAGSTQPLPGVGDRRSGEVGSGRIHLHSGRFPRRRPLGRTVGHAQRAGGPRLLRGHRMGRHPRLVERPGRDCSGSPTTRPTSGSWRHCSHHIWRRSARGRASPTSTETSTGTAAS